MREADAGPGEDGAEAGEGEEPGEGRALDGAEVEEGEEADERRDADGDQRPALAVHVREDLGCLALLGERGQGARGAVHGGVWRR